ncbi:orotate phosphoribosyltransferase [Spirochaetota bacterium]|nr:orotate phosphoribosyltransferase [Spirochaetota bacterium]
MKLATDFAKFLIENKALQFGDFTTKSGRSSPYFINFGILHQASVLRNLAKFYADWIRSHPHAKKLRTTATQSSSIHKKTQQQPFNVIFGPAYKGIPLAIALTLVLSTDANTHLLGYAFDRKEAKLHGDGGSIVGTDLSASPKKVLLVDDVLTSGLSLKNAIETIRSAAPRTEIVGIVVGVDREEQAFSDPSVSARKKLEMMYGIPVFSITTIRQILALNDDCHWFSEEVKLALETYLENHIPTTSPALTSPAAQTQTL